MQLCMWKRQQEILLKLWLVRQWKWCSIGLQSLAGLCHHTHTVPQVLVPLSSRWVLIYLHSWILPCLCTWPFFPGKEGALVDVDFSPGNVAVVPDSLHMWEVSELKRVKNPRISPLVMLRYRKGLFVCVSWHQRYKFLRDTLLIKSTSLLQWYSTHKHTKF